MTDDMLLEATAEAEALDILDLPYVDDVEIARSEVADPEAFLGSERGKAWLAPILSGAYYTRWYDHSRSPHELSWCNELAEKVIEAKRDGACPGEVENVVEEQFAGGQDPEDLWYEDHEADVKRKIEDVAEALDEMRGQDPTIPEMDVDGWVDAVRDLVVDHMCGNDDSSVMDMFGDYDRCELLIRLGGEDHVSSNRPWADFDDLCIDGALQQALAGLGYTVGEYRRMSGNKGASHGVKGGVRKRASKLVDEKELRELVSESSNATFGLYLYAIIPVRQLFDLDLGRPITLSSYSVASYNGGSGTFYDIRRKEAVVIMPGEGTLEAPGRYGPDNICGLYAPAFHADLANA